MSKIQPISNIAAGSMSATKINDAFDKVETAFSNTLSRDGSSPNEMGADLDMNSHDILNANSISTGTLIVGGLTQTPSSLVSTSAEIVVDTVAAMTAYASFLNGNRVRTLGYYSAYDGGGANYLVTTNALFVGTPDDLIDHQLIGSLVAELQHNRVFNLQQCGVTSSFECSDIWNNAVWRAASLAPVNIDDDEQPVSIICDVDVTTNKILHLSREPADEFSSGQRVIMDVDHKGSITAVGGGTFETHLNNEMTRLTALHGSAVALGSSLAAKFLKADPQLAEFLGDKIERPLPIIAASITRSNVNFGDIRCDFWCSGIRINRCSITKFNSIASIFNYRKYGLLYTKNTNNDIKTINVTVKQWGQGDFDDHNGRMMSGGYSEPRNFTGDSIVSCQKDMMWYGGNTGWGRTAVVTLDKCANSTADRWAGRTMYPDYMTRWNDSMWTGHGGAVNAPQWDYMHPSTGTGDNDFYGMHVMQGSAEDSDSDTVFRTDGLDFGGQTGWENWNSTNPVNVYGSDIDSSVTQIFGSSIRFYGPTLTVGNTAKHGCFHPVVRCYAARQDSLHFTEFENWGGSIGVFDFDRGDVGVPNVASITGDFTNWNYRNRVDSGSWTGDVTYRGAISGGAGNLPSGSVVAAGDFFWVIEDGTYGGQAMLKGDILYALTTVPGITYGANWYLGDNDDVIALRSSRTVGISKFVNTLVPHETNEPAIWITKPTGDAAIRLETGLTQYDAAFDGTDILHSLPTNGRHLFDGSVLSKGGDGIGYSAGAGGVVTQITSRTTAVTLNAPSGAITLFSAAGSATPASFLVNNTAVDSTDTVQVTQRTGTNEYILNVTAVNANSFRLNFYTTGGTAVDAPIINFAIIKAAVT